jgi:thiol-disulfide isomerase/thioredoxin
MAIVTNRGAFALLALVAAPAAGAAGPVYPPDSILLFVADWCAPCHAEVARLPELVEAARPARLLVVVTDDRDRLTRAAPPEMRWRPDRALLARLRDDLFADNAGLPYSVAIGADGRPCADSRRGLDAARTRALLAACAGRPTP